jgi:hypothetical protein
MDHHRLSTIAYRPSTIGYRPSAIGHRLSTIGYPAVANTHLSVFICVNPWL